MVGRPTGLSVGEGGNTLSLHLQACGEERYEDLLNWCEILVATSLKTLQPTTQHDEPVHPIAFASGLDIHGLI